MLVKIENVQRAIKEAENELVEQSSTGTAICDETTVRIFSGRIFEKLLKVVMEHNAEEEKEMKVILKEFFELITPKEELKEEPKEETEEEIKGGEQQNE